MHIAQGSDCKPFVVFLVSFTSHQQSFSYVGTGLSGSNQY